MGGTTACFVLCLLSISAQDLRPNAEIRGQSFGLEKFLISQEPLNYGINTRHIEQPQYEHFLPTPSRPDGIPFLPSRSEKVHFLPTPNEPENLPPFIPLPTNKPERIDLSSLINIDNLVHGTRFQNFDHDLLKEASQIVESRAPITFSSPDWKPVDTNAPTLSKRPTKKVKTTENDSREELDIITKNIQEHRRPLERPSVFQLTTDQANNDFPTTFSSYDVPNPTETQRKRVMKRRRKRPSTVQPPLLEELFSSEDVKEQNKNVDEISNEPQNTAESEVDQPRPFRKRMHGKKRQRSTTTTTERTVSNLIDGEVHTISDQMVGASNSDKDIREEQENKNILTTFTPTTDPPQEPTHKLKTLLQQNGPFSLSEVLQTQNLSLADFLSGNPNVLSLFEGSKSTTESVFTATTEKITTTSEPIKPKRISRPTAPKISQNSRPFSKSSSERVRPQRIATTTTTTTETPIEENYLPKTVEIYEVTSDKPNYHGFVPKASRRQQTTRPDFAKLAEQRMEKQASENLKNIIKAIKDGGKEGEKDDYGVKEIIKFSSRVPVIKSTTPMYPPKTSASTVTEKTTPKRYEFKPKRIDRRKYTTEYSAETRYTETTETTKPVPTTQKEIPFEKEIRNKVRIPFMSVNNPQISVILPNKNKPNVTERPAVARERFSLFKRPSQIDDEKPIENTIQDQNSFEEIINTVPNTTPTETTISITVPPTTTSTTTTTTTTSTTPSPITQTPSTTLKAEIEKAKKFESHKKVLLEDDIIDLLKSDSNAMKLENILASRNMTVKELVEQRTRDNTQLNVTKLFGRNLEEQKKKKDDEEELSLFENFPRFRSENEKKVKQPFYPKPSLFDELFVDESIINPIKVSAESQEIRESKSISNSQEQKIKIPFPLWNFEEKTVYNGNSFEVPNIEIPRRIKPSKPPTTESTTQFNDPLRFETTRKVKESHHRVDENEVVKDVTESDRSYIPPAVKSAIIASGVVMGIALLVFVAIFAACGWKQRQIRLRARSSILNDSLNGSDTKVIKRTNTLSPISFKKTALYKKAGEFDDSESTASESSNASSYLWNTLKHTFQSRNSTLKNHQEKENRIRERNTLSRDDNRRSSVISRDYESGRRENRRDSIMSRDTFQSLQRDEMRRSARHESLIREDERCSFRKIDPDRNVIQTSLNFKRGGFHGSRHFDSCGHF